MIYKRSCTQAKSFNIGEICTDGRPVSNVLQELLIQSGAVEVRLYRDGLKCATYEFHMLVRS